MVTINPRVHFQPYKVASHDSDKHFHVFAVNSHAYQPHITWPGVVLIIPLSRVQLRPSNLGDLKLVLISLPRVYVKLYQVD